MTQKNQYHQKRTQESNVVPILDVKSSDPLVHEQDTSLFFFRKGIRSHLHEICALKIARLSVPTDKTFCPQDVQDVIQNLQKNNPSGWIVDLRGNHGRKFWPLLAAIGPLVGENSSGGLVNYLGEKKIFVYKYGKAILQDPEGIQKIMVEVKNPVCSVNDSIPVAFLIDNTTGSSGEALAVIFKGRPNSKGIGDSTYCGSIYPEGLGLEGEGNSTTPVTAFQDREGNLYMNGIEPDIRIPVKKKEDVSSEDKVIDAALDWIRIQIESRKPFEQN